MYDVMVSGYYGFKNSGDDALLMAMIDSLRMFKKDIKILVLSMNPKETKKIYGVDAINRFNVFQILWAMKRSKLLINGGGSLIQDITSTQSLMYYLSIIWMAKKMGLKVMVYANGIGPIYKEANRKLTKRIVNQVDMITLREEGSRQELRRLDIQKPPILVTADPALTLEAVDGHAVDEVFQKEKIDCSGPLIGFSLRDWKGHEKRYGEVIAQIADYMIEKYNVKPVFIPMQYPRDLPIAQKIVSRMQGKGYIIENQYSVLQTLGIVKKMDMLIGMRLHTLIYAASLGVPLIGLVYEPKVAGFLEYVRQKSAGDVTQLETEKLRQLVDEVWNKRDSVRKELEQVTADLKQKALENAKLAIELLDKQVKR